MTCTGNRDLFDDFGVAASPTTGLASIIHSDDQYTDDTNDPPRPARTPGRTNTRPCDHTGGGHTDQRAGDLQRQALAASSASGGSVVVSAEPPAGE